MKTAIRFIDRNESYSSAINYGMMHDEVTPQEVFGHLARLAAPIVKRYHSDLYHDALWVRDYVPPTQPFTFYYGAHEAGTHIGDLDLMESVARNWQNDASAHYFRFDITREERNYGPVFHLTITAIVPEVAQ